MNIMNASKIMEFYAACPECGCEAIGNGKGTLECDTGAGYFKRTCRCGWYVEVQEGIAAPLTVPDSDEKDPPIKEPSIAPDPPSEKTVPVMEERRPPQIEEEIKPWEGFVHIRCDACHKEKTTCLKAPATSYTCEECGYEMELPKAYRAYTHCKCGQRSQYLTNISDQIFDIPCVNCGSPSAVIYRPAKNHYVPIDYAPRRSKPRKKAKR